MVQGTPYDFDKRMVMVYSLEGKKSMVADIPASEHHLITLHPSNRSRWKVGEEDLTSPIWRATRRVRENVFLESSKYTQRQTVDN
jgi:hypothetical protein